MTQRRTLIAASAVGGAAIVLIVLALAGVFGGNGSDSNSSSNVVASPAFGASKEVGNQIHQIYERSAPAVVFIQSRISAQQSSPFGPAPQQGGEALGTGFLIDDQGHIVTNAHVIEGASDVRVQYHRSALKKAKVVGSDLATDLAVLQADPPSGTKPLPLGDSGKAEVGDAVLAIGNPFGLEDTITAGIISAKQRQITAPNGLTIDGAIQTDAAVNPGNSGGPLLEMDNTVIGVNSQIATAPGVKGFVGIAFAIPVSTVQQIVPQLEKSGKVNRGFLGVSAVTVTPDIASTLGLSTNSGALVVSVVKGSPADKAGLRPATGPAGAIGRGGDVIIGAAGQKVATSEGLANAIANGKPGDRVAIEYLRGKTKRTVQVTLAQRPA